MGLISIISAAISIAKLIFELWKMIKEIKKSGEVVQVKDLSEELRSAIQHYKKTGDSGPLFKMKEELKKKCSGVGCPTDTVGL